MKLMSTIQLKMMFFGRFYWTNCAKFMFFIHIFFVFTVKPFLIRGVQNQTAVVGNSVIFQCRVGGEPVPDVLWRRSASGGNMPLSK